MKNQSEKIRQYLIKHIPNHPQDIVSHTMQHFGVSRTTVLRHINYLINQNKVSKTGNTKQISYSLISSLEKQFSINLSEQFDEFDFFSEHLSDILKKQVNTNTYEICEYVITEMLNNAKDHSRGSSAKLNAWFDKDTFYCTISDNGLGAFKTLQGPLKLSDIRDIIFELSKGKLTRDPSNHTGEGLFFSARATDSFSITANDYEFYRDNREEDWTLREVKKTKGTRIAFEISKESQRDLKSLFDDYTEDFVFTKTDILVDLSKHYGERLISRSQAKRICKRLEQFTHITLDFKKVEAVGQGFVDQLFRIFQREHPNIKITYINANNNVDFMIKRGLAGS